MSRLTCSFLLVFIGVLASGAPRARAEAVAGDKIYKQALRATVFIHIRQNGRPVSTGTGWVVDKANRLIVTNHHVVANADIAYIAFPIYKDGRVVSDRSRYDFKEAIPGRVVDSYPSKDLAIIQLRALPADVTELKLSASAAGPGETLHLVGNPGASGGLWTYTSGKVRQLVRRTIRYQGQLVDAEVVETEMASNPGDSGGAVVNDKCEVVAVNSGAHTSARLMTYAIDRAELRTYLAEVRTFLEDKVPSAAALHNRGQRYLAKRWVDKAIDDFNTALRKDKSVPGLYRNRGRAYRMKRDNDSALADLDEALRRDKDDVLALSERGLVWLAKGNRAKAIADQTDAIRLKPRDPVLYVYRGQAYGLDGQSAAALRDLDEAIRLNDRMPTAYEERGIVHHLRRDYANAARDYLKALDLDPTADTWNRLGVALAGTGDYAKALVAYKQALDLRHSEPALVYANRGFSLAALRRHREAIGEFSVALRLNPRQASAYYGRGGSYEQLEQGGDAHSDYVEAVRLNPEYDKFAPLQESRSLRVKNGTNKRIRVYLRYAKKIGGRLVWAPKRELFIDIGPNETMNLQYNGAPIVANSMRIWAQSHDGSGSWLQVKSKNTALCAGPYRARKPGVFTYSFNP